MKDVLTGETIDYFGGLEDINNGVVRHVNDLTFVEDPLRVLRAAQFAARFNFMVCDETIELCSKINLSALPKERIMGELEKALLKSDNPSVFFESLRKMNQLSVWFSEIEAMIGIKQNPAFHPEGDVWNHTMQVLNVAAGMKNQAQNPLWFMLSALCHDLGKIVASTEIDGVIHAYRHECEGVSVAERFLGRLTNELKLKKYVLNMVINHMRPVSLTGKKSSSKSFMKMYDESICSEDLLLLAKSDFIGRAESKGKRELLIKEYLPVETMLNDMLVLYRKRMSKPYLTGADLMQMGCSPGPLMGEALEYAHKLRIAGRPKEEQLKSAMSLLKNES